MTRDELWSGVMKEEVVSIPENLLTALKKHAEAEGRSVSSVMVEALVEKFGERRGSRWGRVGQTEIQPKEGGWGW